MYFTSISTTKEYKLLLQLQDEKLHVYAIFYISEPDFLPGSERRQD